MLTSRVDLASVLTELLVLDASVGAACEESVGEVLLLEAGRLGGSGEFVRDGGVVSAWERHLLIVLMADGVKGPTYQCPSGSDRSDRGWECSFWPRQR